MAAAMHLTLVAPDNEKCTVQSAPGRLGRHKKLFTSPRSSDESKPTIGRLQNPFVPGSVAAKA